MELGKLNVSGDICCSCELPLDKEQIPFQIMGLPFIAEWQFPVMGNLLVGEKMQAVGIVCHDCFRDRIPCKLAIEYLRGETIYHSVNKLKPF